MHMKRADNELPVRKLMPKKSSKNEDDFIQRLSSEYNLIEPTMAFKKELIEALENEQIIPYYQPIIRNERVGKRYSLEALARWVHPTNGIIAPCHFISVLNELNLMAKFGYFFIEKVCKDYQNFVRAGVSLSSISINVSPQQLLEEEFVHNVKAILKKYDIEACNIEFEIVEEMISDESGLIYSQLEALNEYGVKISIDDFGTGYSSLSRLKNLPVSKLKIDKSFVDGIPSSETFICITKTIISLAKGLNLEIVAEGVESSLQAKWLLDHGCDNLQGYLISKPINYEDTLRFLINPIELPFVNSSHYEISYHDNTVDVKSYGNWDERITDHFFLEVISIIEKKKPSSWVFIIDAIKMDIGTIAFQKSVKKWIKLLIPKNLIATLFIVKEYDLLQYQLEMMNVEKNNYKRRFFSSKRDAIQWLERNLFPYESISSEAVIRSIYNITNGYEKGFEKQINQLISMGLKRFHLDVGILSKIDGDRYTVISCVVPDTFKVSVGDEFKLTDTYCDFTYQQRGPVAIEHIAENDRLNKHPAYIQLGLESYIGIPVFCGGEPYGTLNFSSHSPHFCSYNELDIDILELMASWVGAELSRRAQETELKELNVKLQYQSFHDSLTELPNHRGMQQLVTNDLHRITRNGGQGSFIIIDIDHFKYVNDHFGHKMGDEVLKAVAKCIKGSIRHYDFAARIGGEEFILWLPDTEKGIEQLVVDRLVDSLSRIDLIDRAITVSFGVCYFVGEKCATENVKEVLHELFQKADNALYQSKCNGRDCITYSHHSIV